MSVNNPATRSETASVSAACATYMGYRHCEAGSLVSDHAAGRSRCRCCGELD